MSDEHDHHSGTENHEDQVQELKAGEGRSPEEKREIATWATDILRERLAQLSPEQLLPLTDPLRRVTETMNSQLADPLRKLTEAMRLRGPDPLRSITEAMAVQISNPARTMLEMLDAQGALIQRLQHSFFAHNALLGPLLPDIESIHRMQAEHLAKVLGPVLQDITSGQVFHTEGLAKALKPLSQETEAVQRLRQQVEEVARSITLPEGGNMNYTPMPSPMYLGSAEATAYASSFVQRLEKQVQDMQAELAENEALLVSALLPGGGHMAVNFIGYHNPNLIVLYGDLDETRKDCRLLVHQNSLQLLCSIEHKQHPPRHPIGFQVPENRESTE